MFSRRSYAVLAAILVLVVIPWRVFSDHLDERWITDGFIVAAVRPVIEWGRSLREGATGLFHGSAGGSDSELTEEASRLRVENALLRSKLAVLERDHEAAGRIIASRHARAVVPSPPAKRAWMQGGAAGEETPPAPPEAEVLVPARILAGDLFPSSQTILIDRGRTHGVRVDDIAVAEGGLAGRVSRVYAMTSRVTLLTDPSFSVDAVNPRTGLRMLVSGLREHALEGRRGPLLTRVEYLERAEELGPGDTLVTSGVGGVFPPGLAVGSVDGISPADSGVFDTARAVPAVDFTKLTRVFVMTGGGGGGE